MMRLSMLCCFFFSLLISCSSNVQYPSLLLGIDGGHSSHNGASTTSTVDSISSIRILGGVKKEPSPAILIAMRQCEAAILKPRNDEMLKGPSFCLGLLKQSLGQLEGALEDYELAIARYPSNGAACFNAAGILENMGKDADAAIKYKMAMLVPETCEASFSKLISLLLRNDRDEEAKLACLEMLKESPLIRYKAYENLGATLHKMGSHHESFSAYERALKVCNNPLYSSDPKDGRLVEALNNAAQAASAIPSGDRKIRERAEEYHLRSIQVAPGNADSHTYYGIFLKYENRISEATQEFSTAISLDPQEKFKETGYAAVQLASITGVSSKSEMNQNYVSGLFDGYADRFDSELCGKLAYKGHEQVVAALLAVFNNAESGQEDSQKPIESDTSIDAQLANRDYSIIDVGCGTGLCGALLRKELPNAHISGVDLSQRMLEKSIERGGCYNALALGDAVEFLTGVTPSSIDAVIAADVFIYIGDLEKVFESSYRALKPRNSLLVFTVEELVDDSLESVLNADKITLNVGQDQGAIDANSADSDDIPDALRVQEKGFSLRESGRFSHTQRYIRRLATDVGFRVVSATKEVIRFQSEVPVKSITFVLTKL